MHLFRFVFYTARFVVCSYVSVFALWGLADGHSWLTHWRLAHSIFPPAWPYFNHAGNLPPAPRQPRGYLSPHIGAIFLLIETNSATTAFSRGGKWQVNISRRLFSPPTSLFPFGESGSKVDKFMWGLGEDTTTYTSFRASKGCRWCHLMDCRCVCVDLSTDSCVFIQSAEAWCMHAALIELHQAFMEKNSGEPSCWVLMREQTRRGSLCSDLTQSAYD